MFQLTTEYSFERTVEVKRPSPTEKDKILRETFTAQFKAVNQDRLSAFEQALNQSITVQDSVRVLIDFVGEVTTGWSDVVDENKAPVPFTPESFGTAVRVPWIRDGMISSYRAAMRGEEVRLGN